MNVVNASRTNHRLGFDLRYFHLRGSQSERSILYCRSWVESVNDPVGDMLVYLLAGRPHNSLPGCRRQILHQCCDGQVDLRGLYFFSKLAQVVRCLESRRNRDC